MIVSILKRAKFRLTDFFSLFCFNIIAIFLPPHFKFNDTSSYYGVQKIYNYDHSGNFKAFIIANLLLIVFFFIGLLFKRKFSNKTHFHQSIIILIAILLTTVVGGELLRAELILKIIIISLIASFLLSWGLKSSSNEPTIDYLSHLKSNKLKIFYLTSLSFLLSFGLMLGYLNYQSFHWGEMSIYAKFWDFSESPTKFIPRHGLFEIFLQKILFNSGLPLIATIEISMFIVKFFSPLATIALSVLLTATQLPLVFLVVFLVMTHYSYSFAIFSFTLALPIFFINKPNWLTPRENWNYIFIGILLGVNFFLRVEYGAFAVIAFFITMTAYRKFELMTFCALGLMISTGLYCLIWGPNSLTDFIKYAIVLQAKYSGPVWASQPLNLYMPDLVQGKLIAQLNVIAISIWISLHSLFSNHTNRFSFIYLTLINCATTTILFGRIDMGRQFWFFAFLTTVPMVVFVYRQKFEKTIALFAPIAIMFIFAGKIEHPTLVKSWNNFKKLYQSQVTVAAPLDQEEVKCVLKHHPLLKEAGQSVSFFPFSSFLYSYFNIEPLSKYTDSYQVYPYENEEYLAAIHRSKILFWIPANLDGINDALRLPKTSQLISEQFDLIEVNGNCHVYRNKNFTISHPRSD